MSKVTKWYPSSVKPIHIGWYERRSESAAGWTYMAWWNGECFTTGVKNALIFADDREWRGLQEPA